MVSSMFSCNQPEAYLPVFLTDFPDPVPLCFFFSEVHDSSLPAELFLTTVTSPSLSRSASITCLEGDNRRPHLSLQPTRPLRASPSFCDVIEEKCSLCVWFVSVWVITQPVCLCVFEYDIQRERERENERETEWTDRKRKGEVLGFPFWFRSSIRCLESRKKGERSRKEEKIGGNLSCWQLVFVPPFFTPLSFPLYIIAVYCKKPLSKISAF